jgi:transcriptional regulator with XRE-family HTH domain
MVYYSECKKREGVFVVDIKSIIAKNITELRQNAKLTQIELAERLNYSDKAVSKWERAESIPDITVLKAIADMFEVPLDYLVQETHEVAEPVEKEETVVLPDRKRNRRVITILSVLLVWFVATFVYVVLDSIGVKGCFHYLSFAYACPVSVLVWLILNSIWFCHRTNYLIISLLMWTAIGSVVLTFHLLGFHIWKLVFLGILGQLIIITWSMYRYRQKGDQKKQNTEQ